MENVFVYGTLKRGEPNHGLLGDGQFVGEAMTVDRFHLYDTGWYPAMVTLDPENDNDSVQVCGELYKVTPETLKNLDRLEGVPFLFKRVQVTLNDNRTAWAYVWGNGYAVDEENWHLIDVW